MFKVEPPNLASSEDISALISFGIDPKDANEMEKGAAIYS